MFYRSVTILTVFIFLCKSSYCILRLSDRSRSSSTCWSLSTRFSRNWISRFTCFWSSRLSSVLTLSSSAEAWLSLGNRWSCDKSSLPVIIQNYQRFYCKYFCKGVGTLCIFHAFGFIAKISPRRNYTMTQVWRHMRLTHKNCNQA